MRIDMVNNKVNDIDVKLDNLKSNSSIDKIQKNSDNTFSTILKGLKQEKADISKSETLTKNVKSNKLEAMMKNGQSTKSEVKFNQVDKKSLKVENKNKDIEKVDEKEVEENVENLSSEQILQCLSIITDKIQEALNSNSISNDINVNEISIESINTEIKEALINTILGSNENNVDINLNNNMDNAFGNIMVNMEKINEDDSAINIVNNLLETLNKNNVDEILDKDNLSLAKSLLNNLNTKLENENNLGTENSFLKNLVSEVKNDINIILAQKDGQSYVDNSDGLELNTNKAQQGNILSETHKEETNAAQNIVAAESSVNNKVEDESLKPKNELQYDKKDVVNDIDTSKESKGEESNSGNSSTSFSKDEKILNSILKGSKSNSNNSFVMPVTTTVVQNNGDMSVTEVQVINKDSMVPDVIKTVKYMTNNNMKEMIVKINPNNLGEVTIKLIEENGIMKMNIKAASKETYSLLSQQAEEMKNQLSSQNIKIQEVNISLYEEDTTFFKEGEFNNNSFNENKRKNNRSEFNDEDINDERDNTINDIATSAVNMLA